MKTDIRILFSEFCFYSLQTILLGLFMVDSVHYAHPMRKFQEKNTNHNFTWIL